MGGRYREGTSCRCFLRGEHPLHAREGWLLKNGMRKETYSEGEQIRIGARRAEIVAEHSQRLERLSRKVHKLGQIAPERSSRDNVG